MRLLLRLLSPLLGLAVATVGALLAVEAGWLLIQPGSSSLLVPWPDWRDRLLGYAWSHPVVLAIGGLLVILGLLLLVIAIGARRRDVWLTSPADGVTVVTSPRSLARLVGHRVRTEDGVRSASVTASARRIRIRARTSGLTTSAQLRPTLTAQVRDLIASLPLARTPRVRVAVKPRRDRR